jgi:pyruvate dehydrogenase E2 component (dihydrolipoamide acetyltransferase)
MAIPVTVPRLGWSMDEGTFAGWLKQPGESVKKGEMLFALESDKATEEIESFDEGLLSVPPDAPQAGDTVQVGQVLGFLHAAGEAPPGSCGSVAEPAKEMASGGRQPPDAVGVTRSDGRGAAPQRRCSRAVSPRARRVARELGVDVAGVSGSGRNGRVRERDVRTVAAMTASATAQAGHRLGTAPAAGSMTHTRRRIAERMVHSLRSTAPVTLTTTADATNLVNLRNQFKAAGAASAALIPSYTDFLVKLSAVAIEAHPDLNSRWVDEGIVVLSEINIGIAVDTEAGLVVPVLHNVPGLSLRQVAAKSRDLIERARTQKLSADELRGGTFTVTNLGAWGIDAFTPIINYPECAILGVGRIDRRPAVVGDQIVPRDVVTLSLTFDHRLVDGAPAARFLETLRKCIENPGPSLME